jgi:hypothetical protein
MAVARQRPATANGVVFMLLEDEFGQVNLIVPPRSTSGYRAIVRAEPLLLGARTLPSATGATANVLSCAKQVRSGPLARRCADDSGRFGSLPAAHHFATAESPAGSNRRRGAHRRLCGDPRLRACTAMAGPGR